MSRAIINDRRASWSDVDRRRSELRRVAAECGLTDVRLRDDGALIVHAIDHGYRSTGRFAVAAAGLVGAYVHVITDDVPAAGGEAVPL
ncbi:MAG: hypothetical protein J0I11_21270 [Actinobacteria bacterium]|nr:hypothetical protein [Actinomycetota bacterium]